MKDERTLDKTFLLGAGCEKGGTTWLNGYLAAHPQVTPGFGKEYHVLNVHFLPEHRAWQQERIDRDRRIVRALEASWDPRRRRKIGHLGAVIRRRERQLELSQDLGRYVAYFGKLAREGGASRLVCDITPYYCDLPAGAWTEVRALLTEAGFAPRVVFILRDPIERLFSAFRMKLRNAADPSLRPESPAEAAGRLGRRLLAKVAPGMAGRSAPIAAADGAFLEFAREEDNLRKSRYDLTVAALDAAFAPDEVHYAFFETFFNDAELARFTEFAGLEFRPGRYDSKRNASETGTELRATDVAELRTVLDGTYAFCAARFGENLIRAAWQHY